MAKITFKSALYLARSTKNRSESLDRLSYGNVGNARNNYLTLDIPPGAREELQKISNKLSDINKNIMNSIVDIDF
jgi:hypothetical protein